MSLATEISDFAFYPPSNKAAAFIAAPLKKEGTIIGFLAAQLDIDRISAMANDYAGLGRTGEIVVGRKIGDEAVFLTPTRHDPEAAFQRRYRLSEAPPTTVGDSRTEGSTARVPPRITLTMTCGPSGDTCPGFDWGMVVKMDVDEAFAPLAQMRDTAASSPVLPLAWSSSRQSAWHAGSSSRSSA